MKRTRTLSLYRGSKAAAFTTLKPADLAIEKFEKKIPLVLKEAELCPRSLAYNQQVHGARVLVARSAAFRNKQPADGLVTGKKGCLLTVFTADCLPVVLVDEKTECVAAVHCGWKSTYKRIIKNVICKMKNIYGAKAKDIKAVFGPSIQECCYEVGADLAEKFKIRFGGSCVKRRGGKHYLSLQKANESYLLSLGLKKKNIKKSCYCTSCRKDLFYSYRRDGAKAGRMVTCVMLESNTPHVNS